MTFMKLHTSSEKITVPFIRGAKGKNQKISALTAYDYTTARIIDRAGVDIILIGDSLGSVVQGLETTLPVTLEEVIYHSRCVTRGVQRALVVGDLPFLSYQVSMERAVESAGRLIKEGGVSAVKLEGGVHVAPIIERLSQIDVPVMGHVGLTPQSYHRMGGHKIQGRRKGHESFAGSRERILADAQAVEEAGAFSLVIEGVPADLAAEITETVSIPTIGIGAGPACDGQILVVNDMLGLTPDFVPRFVKRYSMLAQEMGKAVAQYVAEVREGKFPTEEHSYHSSEDGPVQILTKFKVV
jgi:3-methyl-2-oxobutanoate hydroxymethyltransferase